MTKKIWESIAIINEEMGSIKGDVKVLKNDVKWIKMFVSINLIAWLGLLTKLLFF